MRVTGPAGGESMGEAVGRFAPTPSGRMHLGNLFSCLLSWLSARSQGGKIILRMENLDPLRTSRAYGEQLMADLRRLGLDWDEGPYWQSERSGYYQQCLDRLDRLGVVYKCFCSRAELHAADAPHASDGDYIYSGKCRGLTEEQIARLERSRSPALRLLVSGWESFTDGHYGPQRFHLPTQCGDFILRRSDGVFAYQLAVAADDGAMGVTEVVRGRDLLGSTPRQLQLYRLLELPAPRFVHIPLLLGEGGRRLSKRDGDLGLDALLERFTPEELVGWLGYLAGQLDRPEAARPEELAKVFDWEKVPREDIVVAEDLHSISTGGLTN